MYALAFFEETKDFDIVPSKNIRQKNKISEVKWEKKWIAAKILLKNDNKLFLERVEVDTDGVITRLPDMAYGDTKVTKAAKKKQIRENVDCNIINSPTIFDEVDEITDELSSDVDHDCTKVKMKETSMKIKYQAEKSREPVKTELSGDHCGIEIKTSISLSNDNVSELIKEPDNDVYPDIIDDNGGKEKGFLYDNIEDSLVNSEKKIKLESPKPKQNEIKRLISPLVATFSDDEHPDLSINQLKGKERKKYGPYDDETNTDNNVSVLRGFKRKLLSPKLGAKKLKKSNGNFSTEDEDSDLESHTENWEKIQKPIVTYSDSSSSDECELIKPTPAIRKSSLQCVKGDRTPPNSKNMKSKQNSKWENFDLEDSEVDEIDSNIKSAMLQRSTEYEPTASERPGIIRYLESLVKSIGSQYISDQDPSSKCNYATMKTVMFMENAIEDLKSREIKTNIRKMNESRTEKKEKANFSSKICNTVITTADIHAQPNTIMNKASASKTNDELLNQSSSSSSSSRNSSSKKTFKKSRSSFDKEIEELFKNSEIIIDKTWLTNTTNSNKHDPAQMARLIFKKMLSREKLATMTVTATTGREVIPTNVYEGIEDYVWKTCRKSRRLSPEEFHKKITKMCCSIRDAEKKKLDK